MNRQTQRRWIWFQQIVDMVVAALGVAIAVTMLVRDSWPVLGVVMALVCLGKIGSSAALKILMDRWHP